MKDDLLYTQRQLYDELARHPCEHVRREAAHKLGELWAKTALQEIKRKIRTGES